MQQIFVDQAIKIATEFQITGEDVKHLILVLRMKEKERLRVSTHEGDSYLCEIKKIEKEQVTLQVIETMNSTELEQKIYLFQALPKGDRMETVIEKAVELGVYEIIPVEMRYCVVKLDEKKKVSRVKRYQTIAQTAAKQSKRSKIPKIHEVMKFEDAVAYANQCDLNILPYECKEGMSTTVDTLHQIAKAETISIMIGPEGGFSKEEIELAKHHQIISLGKRILRTDTAAITAMSMVMLASEIGEINGSIFR